MWHHGGEEYSDQAAVAHTWSDTLNKARLYDFECQTSHLVLGPPVS